MIREPFSSPARCLLMLPLVLSAILAGQSAGGNDISKALQLCRPAIAKQVSGGIGTIDVDGSLSSAGWTAIRGPMTAFLGMGKPAPGHASTDHLIRVDYSFICWVRGGKVAKVDVERLK